jgi:hypothetical protein
MAIQSAKDVTVSTENIKVLIVGDYGSGKSIFASSFPTPALIFDFDRGILSYRGKDFDYCSYATDQKQWLDFEKDQREIAKLVAEGKYKTVIIDSTSTMADLAMERALQLDPKRNPATNGPVWNIHYGIVKTLVEGQIRKILQMAANIVIIAHLQLIKDEETGAVLGAQPLLPGQLSIKLPGYFDEVYYAFTKQKDGKAQYVLQTASKGHYKARSRISGEKHILPFELDVTGKSGYEVLTAAINAGKENAQ